MSLSKSSKGNTIPQVFKDLVKSNIAVTVNDTDHNSCTGVMGITIGGQFVPSDGVNDYKSFAELYGYEDDYNCPLQAHLNTGLGYPLYPKAAAPADIYWGGIYLSDIRDWGWDNGEGDFGFHETVELHDQFYHNIVMPHYALCEFREYNTSIVWRYRECALGCYGYGHHVHAVASSYLGTIYTKFAEIFVRPPLKLAKHFASLPAKAEIDPTRVPGARVHIADADGLSQKDHIESAIVHGAITRFDGGHPFAFRQGKTDTVARVLFLSNIKLPTDFRGLWKFLCHTRSISLATCAFYLGAEGYHKEGYNHFDGQLKDGDEKAIVTRHIERMVSAFHRTPEMSFKVFLNTLISITNYSNIPDHLCANKRKFACLTAIFGGFRMDDAKRVCLYAPVAAEISEHHMQSIAFQHSRGWDQPAAKLSDNHFYDTAIDDDFEFEGALDDEAPAENELPKDPIGMSTTAMVGPELVAGH